MVGMEDNLVVLQTTDAAGEREVIEEYVLDAVTRLPDHPFCEEVSFSRLSTSPHTDEAAVWLFYTGDEDRVVEHERERWNYLVENELLTGWERSDPPQVQNEDAKQPIALSKRLHVLAAHVSRSVFEELESQPAPVDEYPDEDTNTPAGWWVFLYMLTNQQGYSAEDEIAASMQNIKNPSTILVNERVLLQLMKRLMR